MLPFVCLLVNSILFIHSLNSNVFFCCVRTVSLKLNSRTSNCKYKNEKHFHHYFLCGHFLVSPFFVFFSFFSVIEAGRPFRAINVMRTHIIDGAKMTVASICSCIIIKRIQMFIFEILTVSVWWSANHGFIDLFNGTQFLFCIQRRSCNLMVFGVKSTFGAARQGCIHIIYRKWVLKWGKLDQTLENIIDKRQLRKCGSVLKILNHVISFYIA